MSWVHISEQQNLTHCASPSHDALCLWAEDPYVHYRHGSWPVCFLHRLSVMMQWGWNSILSCTPRWGPVCPHGLVVHSFAAWFRSIHVGLHGGAPCIMEGPCGVAMVILFVFLFSYLALHRLVPWEPSPVIPGLLTQLSRSLACCEGWWGSVSTSPQLYFSETRVGVGQIVFTPAIQIHPDIMEVWGTELRNALGKKRPNLGSPLSMLLQLWGPLSLAGLS